MVQVREAPLFQVAGSWVACVAGHQYFLPIRVPTPLNPAVSIEALFRGKPSSLGNRAWPTPHIRRQAQEFVHLRPLGFPTALADDRLNSGPRDAERRLLRHPYSDTAKPFDPVESMLATARAELEAEKAVEKKRGRVTKAPPRSSSLTIFSSVSRPTRELKVCSTTISAERSRRSACWRSTTIGYRPDHRRLPYRPLQLHDHQRPPADALACISTRMLSVPLLAARGTLRGQEARDEAVAVLRLERRARRRQRRPELRGGTADDGRSAQLLR